MLDVSAVTTVFFECSSTCTRFEWPFGADGRVLGGALRGTHQPKESPDLYNEVKHGTQAESENVDSNEISNQVGNKKGKSNRQLRILLKLLNTIFGFGMFVATGTKTIFSSRSPHFFSLKMHRNEEERPKAVLPVLQPQAARRDTFETPQNLGTFLQILFKLFRFVVTLLPNSWKGFDGSIFFG